MSKARTVIIEDEASSLFFLKEEIHRHQNLEIIGEYQDGIEGDGFQMLKRLTCEPAIIFCTGYKKYALDAWDYDASDFIIKPITSERFDIAIKKALEDIQNKQQSQRLKKQKLFVGLVEIKWIDGGLKKSRFFSADEVLYIKGDKDYLIIYLTQSITAELGLPENQLIVKKTMKEAMIEWQNLKLFQIHKRYLINLTKITNWNKTDKSIQIQDTDIALPIGRVYQKEFKKMWEEAI